MSWIAIGLVAAFAMTAPCRPVAAQAGVIGYTGNDGNLYTLQAGSAAPNAVTTDAGREHEYRQLTWSPDGTRMAYVVYGQDRPGAAVSATLFTAMGDGSDRRGVYSSDAAVPFYLSWSPDSASVGFLEVASGKLTLKLVPWRGGPTVTVGMGQPYYWDWMPDGHGLVTHTGSSATDNPDGALISVMARDGATAREQAKGPAPAYFQAPDVSPDGRTFAAAVLASPGQESFARLVQLAPPSMMLALVNPAGGIEKSLLRLQGIAAFSWSPDGTRIALVDGSTTPLGGIVGPLVLVDPAHPGSAQLTGLDRVLAFSWSPDGKRLAAFVPRIVGGAEPSLLLGVFFVDAADGSNRLAAAVRPTTEFLTTVVPFYDQYLRSSTIWSPDGRRIVVDSIDQDGSPGIYVISADEPAPPRRVADGVLPFWSPR
jgi:Tol biopolymer transport system component